MPLIDLSEYLSDDSIKIPLKTPKHPDGKIYEIKSPDAKTGMWLAGLAQLGARAANGDESITEADIERLKFEGPAEKEFINIVLGDDLVNELSEDGVSWTQIQILSQYAFAFFAISPAAADKGVKSGAFSGKAPATNRAQRRAKPKKKASTGAKSGRRG